MFKSFNTTILWDSLLGSLFNKWRSWGKDCNFQLENPYWRETRNWDVRPCCTQGNSHLLSLSLLVTSTEMSCSVRQSISTAVPFCLRSSSTFFPIMKRMGKVNPSCRELHSTPDSYRRTVATEKFCRNWGKKRRCWEINSKGSRICS